MIKNMKWVSLLSAILYAFAGILLLLYPDTSAELLCDILGISLIVAGLISVTVYFMMELRESLYRNDFVQGIILILFGILVIYQKTTVQQLIPFILSIAVIASGFSKLQDAIDAYRLGTLHGWSYIIMAVISVVIGLLVMFNLNQPLRLLFQIVGGGLLFSGLTDIYSAIYLSSKIGKAFAALEMPLKKVEEAEVEVEEAPTTVMHILTADTPVEGIVAETSKPEVSETQTADDIQPKDDSSSAPQE